MHVRNRVSAKRIDLNHWYRIVMTNYKYILNLLFIVSLLIWKFLCCHRHHYLYYETIVFALMNIIQLENDKSSSCNYRKKYFFIYAIITYKCEKNIIITINMMKLNNIIIIYPKMEKSSLYQHHLNIKRKIFIIFNQKRK